jgi:hypothetical protein
MWKVGTSLEQHLRNTPGPCTQPRAYSSLLLALLSGYLKCNQYINAAAGVCGQDNTSWRQQLDQLAADYTSRCHPLHDSALSSGSTASELNSGPEEELLR